MHFKYPYISLDLKKYTIEEKEDKGSCPFYKLRGDGYISRTLN